MSMLSSSHSIRQLEKRNVASEIEIMLWCSRMDLVALANTKGEVTLYRLLWTRAWTLSPEKEGLFVRCMSWRPDGKILAIAYNSGDIVLVSVENKIKLHEFHVDGDVTCMVWTEEEKHETADSLFTSEQEQLHYLKNLDYSSIYLADIKSFTGNESASSVNEDTLKCNILNNQSELNLLAIGTSTGYVHLYIFGTLPLASINLNHYLGKTCGVSHIHFSSNLDLMYISLQNANSALQVMVIDSILLKSHGKELYAIASKHEQLKTLIDYLFNTVTRIKETWENILLEMDTKLSKYASKVPRGGITADFLDLLMFGTYTSDIEEFLVHDLTKKGLEKFGQTIEMSYGNIQKLLLKYVSKIGQNITYHLAELRGLARLKHRFGVLGLQETIITEAIQSNGAFLIKTGEMQQIINHSIVNYKAFFRWLYTSVMHLLDEQVPPEIPQMTQQDQISIAEFLKNFDKIGLDGGAQTGFVMEKLGQYLSDSPLTIERDMSNNEWNIFLKQNHCIANHPLILKHYKEMSLVQQLNHMRESVDAIFSKPKESLKDHFKIVDTFTCLNESNGTYCSLVNCENETKVYYTFLCGVPPCELLCLLEIESTNGKVKTRGVYLYFSQIKSESCIKHDIIDLSFYSTKFLTILIKNASTSTLCQLPIATIADQMIHINTKLLVTEQDIPKVNVCELGAVFKNIDGMIASRIAVSGSRNVCIVLADNKRQVRIYEMEAEEEEEEDADMTISTIKDTEMSVLENSSID